MISDLSLRDEGGCETSESGRSDDINDLVLANALVLVQEPHWIADLKRVPFPALSATGLASIDLFIVGFSPVISISSSFMSSFIF